MSEIKAPSDRPGAGKTVREVSIADQVEAKLGENITPFGRFVLECRRELEAAGAGWTREEIEEFRREREE